MSGGDGERGMAAHTSGPWQFEPHAAYGKTIGGEVMPFGYISTAPTPQPIFELNTVLGWPVSQLLANARLIAAAPELLEACKAAYATHGLTESESGLPTLAEVGKMLSAAIAKAEGK